MDAKRLYELRKSTGLRGSIIRVLVFIYLKIRPPYPHPLRRQHVKAFESYLNGKGRILMLGSSLPPARLKGFGEAEVVQLDIQKFPNVDIVADAETMSNVIPSESFDYVVSMSMLEHTHHPWRVLAEVRKVLKSGGVLYLSVPWIYPFHGEPHDFWRFSVPCIQKLIRDAGLIELDSGSEVSGHGSLYLFLKAYLCETFSFDNSLIFYALEYLLTWLLFPFGLLELIFRLGRRHWYYTDCIVFIVARKPFPSANSNKNQSPSV
jgi:SAM-dependent methyltransferase